MALAVVSTASVNAFVGSGIRRIPRLNNCNANVAMCSNRKQDEGSLFPNKKKDNGILNQNVTAGSFHNQKIIENSSNVIQTIQNIRTRQSNTGPLKASNIEPDRTGCCPSEKQRRQERLDKIKSLAEKREKLRAILLDLMDQYSKKNINN